MPERIQPVIGHETRDVSVRMVGWAAAGLVAAGIVIHFATAGLFRLFERQHPSSAAPSRIELHPHMIAPPPQLQTRPAADLDQFQATENAKLSNYGWIDQQAGVIRIPIQRAMDLIVQRGLPTRGPGTQNSSGITPEQLQQQKATALKKSVRGDR